MINSLIFPSKLARVFYFNVHSVHLTVVASEI